MAYPSQFMNTPGNSGMSPNAYSSFMGYGNPSQDSSSLFGIGDSGMAGAASPYSPIPTNVAAANPITEPTFMQGMLGFKDANGIQNAGWGGMALGAAQGLASAWMGMQQYGLAKDTLKANKDQFAKNYAAQKQTTNSALEDRQRARVASNSGAYESVGNYMTKNGIA